MGNLFLTLQEAAKMNNRIQKLDDRATSSTRTSEKERDFSIYTMERKHHVREQNTNDENFFFFFYVS